MQPRILVWSQFDSSSSFLIPPLLRMPGVTTNPTPIASATVVPLREKGPPASETFRLSEPLVSGKQPTPLGQLDMSSCFASLPHERYAFSTDC
jgi:hypothetical protein